MYYEGQMNDAGEPNGVGQVTDPTAMRIGNKTWNGGFKNGLRHGEGVLWRPQYEQDPYSGGWRRFVGSFYKDNINHGSYTEYAEYNGMKFIVNKTAENGI